MLSLVVSLLLLGQCGLTISAPVPKNMVDLTHVFDTTTLNYPGMRKFRTETVVNGKEDNNVWIFYEDYFSGTHVGTHMDAPGHFIQGAKLVDELPLSNFFGPAAVIDITHKADLNPDAEVEVEDLLHWERITGLRLDGHILLMRSGWSKRWGDRTAYLGTSTEDPRLMHSPGFSPRAAQWLVQNRQLLGVGVDAVSLDNGQGYNNGFPSHKILLRAGLYGLENVDNVDQIPISGAQLTVLPMKIGGGSGAPTRIVATFPVTSYYAPSFVQERNPNYKGTPFGSPSGNPFGSPFSGWL